MLTLVEFELYPPGNIVVAVFAVPIARGSFGIKNKDCLYLRFHIVCEENEVSDDGSVEESLVLIKETVGGEVLSALASQALTPWAAFRTDPSSELGQIPHVTFPVQVQGSTELLQTFPILRKMPPTKQMVFNKQSLRDVKQNYLGPNRVFEPVIAGIANWDWMPKKLFLNIVKSPLTMKVPRPSAPGSELSLQRFLTVQRDHRTVAHQIYGHNPYGGMLREWQIRHREHPVSKLQAKCYYKQTDMQDQNFRGLQLPEDRAPVFLRVGNVLDGESDPNNDLTFTCSTYMLEADDITSECDILIDESAGMMFTVSYNDRAVTNWHDASESRLAQKLLIDTSSIDISNMPSCTGYSEEDSVVQMHVFYKCLPCAAKLSATLLCPRDGSLLFVPNDPCAFDKNGKLTIIAISVPKRSFTEDGFAKTMVRDVFDDPMFQGQHKKGRADRLSLAKCIPLAPEVVGPPPGWSFTVMRDHYKKGNDGQWALSTLMGNEHSWVWWQKGRVLVGMMHNSELRKIGVALLTFQYKNDQIEKISKFKLVQIGDSKTVPWLFGDKTWPVRLVGHHGRYLVFRNGYMNYAAVRMLHQRMDMVPNDLKQSVPEYISTFRRIDKVNLWHLLNFDPQLRELGQQQKMGTSNPHVSQVQILAGGILVARCRYMDQQVEFMARLLLRNVWHSAKYEFKKS